MTVENVLRSTISEESFTILFELLLWINPVKSLCFVTGIHLGLFILSSAISKGLLFLVAVYLLFKLWGPIWSQTIWPSIQLPEFARLNDWLTLNPDIPPYAETIKIISKFIEECMIPFNSLSDLRKADPAKYLLYATLACFALAIIGQKVSGFFLCYVVLSAFFFSPLLIKNTVLDMIERENNPTTTVDTPIEAAVVERNIKTTLIENSSTESLIPTDRDSDSENMSAYTESEDEDEGAKERRESVYDPLAEPTWMEDFGRNITENLASVTQVLSDSIPNVTSQIEEAIGMSLCKEKESSGSESADSDKSDFVLLSTEDAKKK